MSNDFEKITTPEFRASFTHVFEKNAFNNDAKDAKYSIVMLFPKETDISKLKLLAKSAVEKKWPDVNSRPKSLRSPFRDGDAEKGHMDGYPGHTFITASSKSKPKVVDCQMNEIIEDDVFYAGCYAKASLTAYAYGGPGTKFTPGVAFGLQNIQKQRDGERFGGGAGKPEDDFDVFDDGSTDANVNAGAANDAGDDMFG